MPQLFELCSKKKSQDDLLNLKKQLDEEEMKIREEEHRRMEAKHRATHIFDSYEDALDWLVENPGSVISWHVKTLSWQPEENRFLSYEQEYSMDGVIPYNVRRFYTREELLDGIYSVIKERGIDISELKDKFEKLDYVHIIKKETK